MVSALAVVAAPSSPVYRVAYGPDPFLPRAWDDALEDGTFGNRFDDPGALPGLRGRHVPIPVSQRFRTIYCSTQRAGAYGETVARFRPSPSLYLSLSGISGDEPVDPSLAGGVVPVGWRMQRFLGVTTIDPRLEFVDVSAPESHGYLNLALADVLTALGIGDGLDLSRVTGQDRRLTQEIARFVYERSRGDGRPRFAGLRYISRLCPDWECWAIFEPRFVHQAHPSESIFPDDPGLIEACSRLGLQPPRAF